MARTREQILEERARLRVEFKELFDSTAAILFRHDPAGINFEINPGEYEAEVGTILPRLRDCHSVTDARRVIHEEFVRWFDSATAGSEERYGPIATEIWELWQGFDRRDTPIAGRPEKSPRG